MTSQAFLLLHGLENHRPVGHWQHWLASELAATGAAVLYPQLPEPDAPVLSDWLAALDDQLGALVAAPATERVVVTHSLSSLLWCLAAEDGRLADRGVDRVMLVATPAPTIVGRIPGLGAFNRMPGAALAHAAATTWAVSSQDDPFCPDGMRELFLGAPGVRTVELRGQGHLTPSDGYGPWPSLRDWCLDPSHPLVARDEA